MKNSCIAAASKKGAAMVAVSNSEVSGKRAFIARVQIDGLVNTPQSIGQFEDGLNQRYVHSGWPIQPRKVADGRAANDGLAAG